jgi:hypothetical protein
MVRANGGFRYGELTQKKLSGTCNALHDFNERHPALDETQTATTATFALPAANTKPGRLAAIIRGMNAGNSNRPIATPERKHETEL